MLEARSGSYGLIFKHRPFRVIVSIITLGVFLFTTFSQDLAWAAKGPTELTSLGSKGAGSPGSFKELNVETFSLPAYLGHIKDSWQPASSTLRRGQTASKGHAQGESLPSVVIHIQDAHCNYNAQRRISDIVDYLNANYGISTINLEGGAKGYDLGLFTDISDKSIREKVADYFVKEGMVNGSEYYAINNPDKVNLWGIEDTSLYLENLKVYRDSLEHKEDIDKYLKSLNYVLNNLKSKIYSKELFEFDIKYSAYKADKTEFKDYINYLIAKAKERMMDVKGFNNIFILTQTLDEEGSVDFRLANREREALMDAIQKRLSRNALAELVAKAVEFKQEKISQNEFYSYLADKARKQDIDMTGYPELQKYILYVSRYETIDKTKIMKEVDTLENKIKESLYKNDTDKKLSELSKTLALTRNIFNISISMDDYRFYKARESDFDVKNYTHFIEKEAPLCGITARPESGIERLDGYREDIAKFYECSFKRDRAFMKNIRFGTIIADPDSSSSLRGLRSRPKQSQNQQTSKPANQLTILVTGGFHTENLAELFRKNKIAYVSIMPNFKNGNGYDCPYFGLLKGDHTNGIETQIRSVLRSTIAIASPFNALGRIVAEKINGTKAEEEEMIQMLEVQWVRAALSGKGIIIYHNDKDNILGAINVNGGIIARSEVKEMDKSQFVEVPVTQLISTRLITAPKRTEKKASPYKKIVEPSLKKIKYTDLPPEDKRLLLKEIASGLFYKERPDLSRLSDKLHADVSRLYAKRLIEKLRKIEEKRERSSRGEERRLKQERYDRGPSPEQMQSLLARRNCYTTVTGLYPPAQAAAGHPGGAIQLVGAAEPSATAAFYIELPEALKEHDVFMDVAKSLFRRDYAHLRDLYGRIATKDLSGVADDLFAGAIVSHIVDVIRNVDGAGQWLTDFIREECMLAQEERPRLEYNGGADVEMDKRFPGLMEVLSQPERLRRFLFVSSFLRIAWPFSESTGSFEPPLQWALKHKAAYRLMDDIYITPITESFRRHTIFRMSENREILTFGNGLNAMELKMPGNVDDRWVSYNNFDIPKELYPSVPIKRPLFNMELLPSSRVPVYGRQEIVSLENQPIRIVAFDYPVDGKRLSNMHPGDSAEVVRSVLESVYLMHGRGWLCGPDLHLENWMVGRSLDGSLNVVNVGDTESFKLGRIDSSELKAAQTLEVEAIIGMLIHRNSGFPDFPNMLRRIMMEIEHPYGMVPEAGFVKNLRGPLTIILAMIGIGLIPAFSARGADIPLSTHPVINTVIQNTPQIGTDWVSIIGMTVLGVVIAAAVAYIIYRFWQTSRAAPAPAAPHMQSKAKARELFEKFFGKDAIRVLQFVSGAGNTLDDIEGYERDREQKLKYFMGRVMRENVVKVAGQEIVFWTKYHIPGTSMTGLNAQLFGESDETEAAGSIRSEFGRTSLAAGLNIAPAVMRIGSPESPMLIFKDVNGKGLGEIELSELSVDDRKALLRACGASLGKLHSLGFSQHDFTRKNAATGKHEFVDIHDVDYHDHIFWDSESGNMYLIDFDAIMHNDKEYIPEEYKGLGEALEHRLTAAGVDPNEVKTLIAEFNGAYNRAIGAAAPAAPVSRLALGQGKQIPQRAGIWEVDSLYKFRNPIQAARVRYIHTVTGIINPEEEIVKICETVAREALNDMGLRADEYIVVVADSDELNAAFYNKDNEKVVEINIGLLQFLRRHNILSKDTLRFILGHEAGHALTNKEKKDGEERHGVLIEEYRADEYGLSSINKRDATPLAGLKFIEALRKEGKRAVISITHPQIHRRQIKIFNEIRYNYWRNLSDKPDVIDSTLLDIERSGCRQFDEALYSNISIDNIINSIRSARTHHNLLKLMHLLSFVLDFKTALEELKRNGPNGPLIALNSSDNFIERMIEDFKKGEARSVFIMKYLNDEGIDPKDYLSSEIMEKIKAAASGMEVTFTDKLLNYYLACSMEMSLGEIKQYTFYDSEIEMYATRKPAESEISEGRKAVAFWENKKSFYRNINNGNVYTMVGKKTEELVPEMAGLSGHDRQALLDMFFLAPLQYLHEDLWLDNGTATREKFKAARFDNPLQAISIMLRYAYKFRNEYLENLPEEEGRWGYTRYIRIKEDRINLAINATDLSRSKYIDWLINKMLQGIKLDDYDLDELLKLYTVSLENKNTAITTIQCENMVSQSFTDKVEELIFSKVKTFADFKRVFEQINAYVGTEFGEERFFRDTFENIIKNLDIDEVIPFMEFLLSDNRLREKFYNYMDDVCARGITLGLDPEMLISELDRLLKKYDLEKYWAEDTELPRWLRKNLYLSLARAYAVLIGNIADNERKKSLIAHYYAKCNHEDSTDSLTTLLMETLEAEVLTPAQQMKYMTEQGFLVYKDMIGSITDSKGRTEIFSLLKNDAIRQKFFANRISEIKYRGYVSWIAWSWFFNSTNMPQYTTTRTNTLRVDQVFWNRETTQEARPLNTLNEFLALLETSSVNASYFRSFIDRFQSFHDKFSELSDEDFEILFRILKISPSDFSIPPLQPKLFIKYEEFSRTDKEQYEREKDGYPPFYYKTTEDLTQFPDFPVGLGLIVLDGWIAREKKKTSAAAQISAKKIYIQLKGGSGLGKDTITIDDPVSYFRSDTRPIKEKIDIIAKCLPHESEYRNKILIELVGGPFKADAESLEMIFVYMRKGYLKDIIAKRIILARHKAGELNLKTYSDVMQLLGRYFAEETPLKRELMGILLQDAEMTLDELDDYRKGESSEIVAKDIKKSVIHEMLEKMADDLERKPAADKRELFEWLIGLSPEKPKFVRFYEFVFEMNMDDLPSALAAMSKVERYVFLGVLLVGPVKQGENPWDLKCGVLNDKTQRDILLINIFKSVTGQEADDKNSLFLIFKELFLASPELKQMDLLHGLFEYCMEHGRPTPEMKNEIIVRLLMSFGVVGVKMGQVLARTDLIKDESLKKALKSCNDDVIALDKRFVFNAIAFDNDMGQAKKVIKTIGRLLGSASIKQGYIVTKADGSQRAFKYIRPLARYEITENLMILREVLGKLRGRIKELEQVSDTLYEEVEKYVLKEFDLEQEKAHQQDIGGFSNGERGYGWRIEVPFLDKGLNGKNFMMDKFCDGISLDKAMAKGILNEDEIQNVSRLLLRMIFKQVFILGRYHADLHEGNIKIDPKTKTIYILDFGNCGAVSKGGRLRFLAFLACLTARKGLQGRIKKMLLHMTSGEMKELPQNVSEELDRVINGNINLADTVKQMKEILERNKISFKPEIEVLFKYFETVRYLFERSGLDNGGIRGLMDFANIAGARGIAGFIARALIPRSVALAQAAPGATAPEEPGTGSWLKSWGWMKLAWFWETVGTISAVSFFMWYTGGSYPMLMPVVGASFFWLLHLPRNREAAFKWPALVLTGATAAAFEPHLLQYSDGYTLLALAAAHLIINLFNMPKAKPAETRALISRWEKWEITGIMILTMFGFAQESGMYNFFGAIGIMSGIFALRYLQEKLAARPSKAAPAPATPAVAYPPAINDLIRTSLPDKYYSSFQVPNLPLDIHRELERDPSRRILTHHLQAMLDALNNANQYPYIPEEYRAMLADPANRRFFEQFILLHDIGKTRIDPKTITEEGRQLQLYPNHEAESVVMMEEDTTLAKDLPNRDVLIEVIRLHGALYGLSGKEIDPKEFRTFVQNIKLPDKRDEVLKLLIACDFLDTIGTDRPDPWQPRVVNFAKAYEIYKKEQITMSALAAPPAMQDGGQFGPRFWCSRIFEALRTDDVPKLIELSNDDKYWVRIAAIARLVSLKNTGQDIFRYLKAGDPAHDETGLIMDLFLRLGQGRIISKIEENRRYFDSLLAGTALSDQRAAMEIGANRMKIVSEMEKLLGYGENNFIDIARWDERTPVESNGLLTMKAVKTRTQKVMAIVLWQLLADVAMFNKNNMTAASSPKDVIAYIADESTLSQIKAEVSAKSHPNMSNTEWLRAAFEVAYNPNNKNGFVKTGAVLVSRDGKVIGVGYNGAPSRQYSDMVLMGGDIRQDDLMGNDKAYTARHVGGAVALDIRDNRPDLRRSICAEQRAMMMAVLNGEDMEGATMYCNLGPGCNQCTEMMLNMGISGISFARRFHDQFTERIYASHPQFKSDQDNLPPGIEDEILSSSARQSNKTREGRVMLELCKLRASARAKSTGVAEPAEPQGPTPASLIGTSREQALYKAPVVEELLRALVFGYMMAGYPWGFEIYTLFNAIFVLLHWQVNRSEFIKRYRNINEGRAPPESIIFVNTTFMPIVVTFLSIGVGFFVQSPVIYYAINAAIHHPANRFALSKGIMPASLEPLTLAVPPAAAKVPAAIVEVAKKTVPQASEDKFAKVTLIMACAGHEIRNGLQALILGARVRLHPKFTPPPNEAEIKILKDYVGAITDVSDKFVILSRKILYPSEPLTEKERAECLEELVDIRNKIDALPTQEAFEFLEGKDTKQEFPLKNRYSALKEQFEIFMPCINTGKLELKLEPINLNDNSNKLREVVRTETNRYIKSEYGGDDDIKIIDVEYSLIGSMPYMETDVRLLKAIVRNILKNACEAMQVNDDKQIERGRSLKISVTKQGEGVTISFADTGPGFTKDGLANYGKLYHTTKKDRGGTGIGSTLVKLATEALGGSIKIESEEGKGAKFTLYLPSARPLPESAPIPGSGPGTVSQATQQLIEEAKQLDTIGERIAYIRNKLSWSQQYLGDKVWPKSNHKNLRMRISAYERGHKNPVRLIDRIAGALAEGLENNAELMPEMRKRLIIEVFSPKREDPENIIANAKSEIVLEDRVRFIRERLRWSQYDLEDKSGVTQRTISNIELGEDHPTQETTRKISDAFAAEMGVDKNELMRDLFSGYYKTEETLKKESMAYEKLGREIKEFRMAQGLSQQDLADNAGFSSHTKITRLENGSSKERPDDKTLQEVAEALGLPDDYLQLRLSAILAEELRGMSIPSRTADNGPHAVRAPPIGLQAVAEVGSWGKSRWWMERAWAYETIITIFAVFFFNHFTGLSHPAWMPYVGAGFFWLLHLPFNREAAFKWPALALTAATAIALEPHMLGYLNPYILVALAVTHYIINKINMPKAKPVEGRPLISKWEKWGIIGIMVLTMFGFAQESGIYNFFGAVGIISGIRGLRYLQEKLSARLSKTASAVPVAREMVYGSKQEFVFEGTLEELRKKIISDVEDGAKIIQLDYLWEGLLEYTKAEFLSSLEHDFKIFQSEEQSYSPEAHAVLRKITYPDGKQVYALMISESKYNGKIGGPNRKITGYHTTSIDLAKNIIKYGFYQLPGRWTFSLQAPEPGKFEHSGNIVLIFSLDSKDLNILQELGGDDGLLGFDFSASGEGVHLPDELRKQIEAHSSGIDQSPLLNGDKYGFLVHQRADTIDIEETLKVNKERLDGGDITVADYDELCSMLQAAPAASAGDNADAISQAISLIKIDPLIERGGETRKELEDIARRFIDPNKEDGKKMLANIKELSIYQREGYSNRRMKISLGIGSSLIGISVPTLLYVLFYRAELNLTTMLMGLPAYLVFAAGLSFVFLGFVYRSYSKRPITGKAIWRHILLDDDEYAQTTLAHEFGHFLCRALDLSDPSALLGAAFEYLTGAKADVRRVSEHMDYTAGLGDGIRLRMSPISIPEVKRMMYRHNKDKKQLGDRHSDYEGGAYIAGIIRGIFEDDDKRAFELLISLFREGEAVTAIESTTTAIATPAAPPVAEQASAAPPQTALSKFSQQHWGEELESVLKSSELNMSQWLGTLNDSIIQKYNGNKKLKILKPIMCFGGADYMYRNMTDQQKEDIYNQLADTGDDDYVYAPIITARYQESVDGFSWLDRYEHSIIIVKKSGLVSAVTFSTFKDVDNADRMILFMREYSIKVSFDIPGGIVRVMLEQMALHKDFRGQGLMKAAFANFAGILIANFEGGDISGSFSSPAALSMFKDCFADPRSLPDEEDKIPKDGEPVWWTARIAPPAAPAAPGAGEQGTPNVAAGDNKTNEDVGTYIAAKITANMPDLNCKMPEERLRKLDALVAAGKDAYKKEDIYFIKIEGLLDNMNQFGHIGFGRTYGATVVYIDKDIADLTHKKVEKTGLDHQNVRDTIEGHELAEIFLWTAHLGLHDRRELISVNVRDNVMRKDLPYSFKIKKELHKIANSRFDVDAIAEEMEISYLGDGVDELTDRPNADLDFDMKYFADLTTETLAKLQAPRMLHSKHPDVGIRQVLKGSGIEPDLSSLLEEAKYIDSLLRHPASAFSLKDMYQALFFSIFAYDDGTNKRAMFEIQDDINRAIFNPAGYHFLILQSGPNILTRIYKIRSHSYILNIDGRKEDWSVQFMSKMADDDYDAGVSWSYPESKSVLIMTDNILNDATVFADRISRITRNGPYNGMDRLLAASCEGRNRSEIIESAEGHITKDAILYGLKNRFDSKHAPGMDFASLTYSGYLAVLSMSNSPFQTVYRLACIVMERQEGEYVNTIAVILETTAERLGIVPPDTLLGRAERIDYIASELAKLCRSSFRKNKENEIRNIAKEIYAENIGIQRSQNLQQFEEIVHATRILETAVPPGKEIMSPNRRVLRDAYLRGDTPSVSAALDESAHHGQPPRPASAELAAQPVSAIDKSQAKDYQGKIIVVGGSAFGYSALMEIIKRFPPGDHAPIIVCEHNEIEKEPNFIRLMRMLSRRHKIIYCPDYDEGDERSKEAPSDCYLERGLILIGHNNVRIEKDAKGYPVVRVYRKKPKSILYTPVDMLFASAAEQFGQNTTCIVVSGGGNDCVQGARQIQERGGTVLVQKIRPQDGRYANGMTDAVIKAGIPHEQISIEKMAERIRQADASSAAPPETPSTAAATIEALRGVSSLQIRETPSIGATADLPQMPPAPAAWERPAARKLDETTCRSIQDSIMAVLAANGSRLEKLASQDLKYGTKSPAEKYPFERWGKMAGDLTKVDSVFFMRIGYLFFIAKEKYDLLDAEFKNLHGDNVIVIESVLNSIYPEFGNWTILTIIAMMNSDLVNKRVIDCGAGEGILSLVALKLGAKSVDLIDVDSKALNEKAAPLLNKNGFNVDKGDYRLHAADLRDTDRLSKALNVEVLDKAETAIVSNIGTWAQYEGVTNAYSINLIDIVPNVTLFIGGGYAAKPDVLEGDLGLLSKKGFNSNLKKFFIGGFEPLALSFSAAKGEGIAEPVKPATPETVGGFTEIKVEKDDVSKAYEYFGGTNDVNIILAGGVYRDSHRIAFLRLVEKQIESQHKGSVSYHFIGDETYLDFEAGETATGLFKVINKNRSYYREIYMVTNMNPGIETAVFRDGAHVVGTDLPENSKIKLYYWSTRQTLLDAVLISVPKPAAATAALPGKQKAYRSPSEEWGENEKIIVDEATVNQYVTPEIKMLFEIAEELDVRAILTGGTARDFAISSVHGINFGFPNTTDYDIAIMLPMEREKLGAYYKGKYKKFQKKVADRLRSMGKDEKTIAILDIDFVPGFITGKGNDLGYIYKHVLKSDTGNAFTVSRLAVEKKDGKYVIFGREEAIKDLKNKKLRVLQREDLSIGDIVGSKMIGKAMIYNQAGFTWDEDSIKKVRAEIPPQESSSYRTFVNNILRHAQTSLLCYTDSHVMTVIEAIRQNNIASINPISEAWISAIETAQFNKMLGKDDVGLISAVGEWALPQLRDNANRVETIRGILEMFNAYPLKSLERARLESALRAVLEINGLGDIAPAQLNVVVQFAKTEQLNTARNQTGMVSRAINKPGSELMARSLVGEYVEDRREMKEKMSDILNKAIEEMDKAPDPKDARTLVYLPQSLKTIFEEIDPKNSRVRVQLIEQGDDPDAMTQFMLGVAIIDFIRACELKKAVINEPTPMLVCMLSAFTDGQNPLEILKKLFDREYYLLVARKIDWNAEDAKRRAWEAVRISL